MQIKIDYNKVIVSMERFIDEFKSNPSVIGFAEFDYIYGSYESLIKMSEKPANVYLDTDDIKLLLDFL